MTDPIATSTIATQAFIYMELRPLSSYADDSQEAEAARVIYSEARDIVLSSYDWAIARRVVSLPAYAGDDLVAEDDLPYAYRLPDGALVVRHVYTQNLWRQDALYIRADEAAPLKLRYTARVDREKDLPAVLRTAIALQMATMLAARYVTNRGKRRDLIDQLDAALAEARRQDQHSASPMLFDTGQATSLSGDWVSEALT